MRDLAQKTKEHPCFNAGASHTFGRMHIPVAPKCNIKCNYCNRKYDCQNESRPGVTSDILTPEQALEKYIKIKNDMPHVKVVGIAGPGDALANYESTKKTLQLIHDFDPDVTFCLSTNGLKLTKYADELIELGVTHFTITINTIYPETAAEIYKYVNWEGKKYFGLEGASLLLKKQWEALAYLKDKPVIKKVNIVLIKGINDNHIKEVVQQAKDYGADVTNIMPLIPVADTVFEDLEEISRQELIQIRLDCNEIMPQMMHCTQCRADAVGTLGSRCSGALA